MFLYDEPPVDCFECAEKENILGDVKYWFRAVLEQLYGVEKFNEVNLERYLEETCAYLGMSLPKRDLNVQEKDKSVNSFKPLDLMHFLQAANVAQYQNLKEAV